MRPKLNQFIVGIPLALLLGFLLATPDNWYSVGFVAVVMGALLIPLVLKWHHPLLILSWNSAFIVFFLPSQPMLWIVMSGISLIITIVTHVLDLNINPGKPSVRFVNIPSITWTIVLFLVIVIVTALFRGGIGIRSMGGETFGGKNYFIILSGAMGFFAISSNPIPMASIPRYIGLFFLGSLTLAMSNLIYMAGPNFYWLYNLISLESAVVQATADFNDNALVRVSGFSLAMTGAFSYMLARYGIRGIFQWGQPFRLILFFGIIVVSLLGGFRSVLIFMALLFIIQFYLEGLFKTRYFLLLITLGLLMFSFLLAFSDRLPFSVQRTISFLPFKIDPAIRSNAAATTEWRVNMWKVVWLEVPEYLWMGKGYAINPTDLYFAEQSANRFAEDFDQSLIAGDYHSGPLSVLVTFGIFGTITFIALGVMGIRFLYAQYQSGRPDLIRLNTLLLALFTARFIFFWVVFGAIASDFGFLLGVLAISISINRQPDEVLEDERGFLEKECQITENNTVTSL